MATSGDNDFGDFGDFADANANEDDFGDFAEFESAGQDGAFAEFEAFGEPPATVPVVDNDDPWGMGVPTGGHGQAESLPVPEIASPVHRPRSPVAATLEWQEPTTVRYEPLRSAFSDSNFSVHTQRTTLTARRAHIEETHEDDMDTTESSVGAKSADLSTLSPFKETTPIGPVSSAPATSPSKESLSGSPTQPPTAPVSECTPPLRPQSPISQPAPQTSPKSPPGSGPSSPLRPQYPDFSGVAVSEHTPTSPPPSKPNKQPLPIRPQSPVTFDQSNQSPASPPQQQPVSSGANQNEDPFTGFGEPSSVPGGVEHAPSSPLIGFDSLPSGTQPTNPETAHSTATNENNDPLSFFESESIVNQASKNTNTGLDDFDWASPAGAPSQSNAPVSQNTQSDWDMLMNEQPAVHSSSGAFESVLEPSTQSPAYDNVSGDLPMDSPALSLDAPESVMSLDLGFPRGSVAKEILSSDSLTLSTGTLGSPLSSDMGRSIGRQNRVSTGSLGRTILEEHETEEPEDNTHVAEETVTATNKSNVLDFNEFNDTNYGIPLDYDGLPMEGLERRESEMGAFDDVFSTPDVDSAKEVEMVFGRFSNPEKPPGMDTIAENLEREKRVQTPTENVQSGVYGVAGEENSGTVADNAVTDELKLETTPPGSPRINEHEKPEISEPGMTPPNDANFAETPQNDDFVWESPEQEIPKKGEIPFAGAAVVDDEHRPVMETNEDEFGDFNEVTEGNDLQEHVQEDVREGAGRKEDGMFGFEEKNEVEMVEEKEMDGEFGEFEMDGSKAGEVKEEIEMEFDSVGGEKKEGNDEEEEGKIEDEKREEDGVEVKEEDRQEFDVAGEKDGVERRGSMETREHGVESREEEAFEVGIDRDKGKEERSEHVDEFGDWDANMKEENVELKAVLDVKEDNEKSDSVTDVWNEGTDKLEEEEEKKEEDGGVAWDKGGDNEEESGKDKEEEDSIAWDEGGDNEEESGKDKKEEDSIAWDERGDYEEESGKDKKKEDGISCGEGGENEEETEKDSKEEENVEWNEGDEKEEGEGGEWGLQGESGKEGEGDNEWNLESGNKDVSEGTAVSDSWGGWGDGVDGEPKAGVDEGESDAFGDFGDFGTSNTADDDFGDFDAFGTATTDAGDDDWAAEFKSNDMAFEAPPPSETVVDEQQAAQPTLSASVSSLPSGSAAEILLLTTKSRDWGEKSTGLLMELFEKPPPPSASVSGPKDTPLQQTLEESQSRSSEVWQRVTRPQTRYFDFSKSYAQTVLVGMLRLPRLQTNYPTAAVAAAVAAGMPTQQPSAVGIPSSIVPAAKTEPTTPSPATPVTPVTPKPQPPPATIQASQPKPIPPTPTPIQRPTQTPTPKEHAKVDEVTPPPQPATQLSPPQQQPSQPLAQKSHSPTEETPTNISIPAPVPTLRPTSSLTSTEQKHTATSSDETPLPKPLPTPPQPTTNPPQKAKNTTPPPPPPLLTTPAAEIPGQPELANEMEVKSPLKPEGPINDEWGEPVAADADFGDDDWASAQPADAGLDDGWASAPAPDAGLVDIFGATASSSKALEPATAQPLMPLGPTPAAPISESIHSDLSAAFSFMSSRTSEPSSPTPTVPTPIDLPTAGNAEVDGAMSLEVQRYVKLFADLSFMLAPTLTSAEAS